VTKVDRQAAVQRIRKLKLYLNWIRINPSHVDPIVKPAAVDFLQMQIARTQLDIKKNRRLGRSPLRIRLRNLVTSILPHNSTIVKGDTNEI